MIHTFLLFIYFLAPYDHMKDTFSKDGLLDVFKGSLSLKAEEGCFFFVFVFF